MVLAEAPEIPLISYREGNGATRSDVREHDRTHENSAGYPAARGGEESGPSGRATRGLESPAARGGVVYSGAAPARDCLVWKLRGALRAPEGTRTCLGTWAPEGRFRELTASFCGWVERTAPSDVDGCRGRTTLDSADLFEEETIPLSQPW